MKYGYSDAGGANDNHSDSASVNNHEKMGTNNRVSMKNFLGAANNNDDSESVGNTSISNNLLGNRVSSAGGGGGGGIISPISGGHGINKAQINSQFFKQTFSKKVNFDEIYTKKFELYVSEMER